MEDSIDRVFLLAKRIAEILREHGNFREARTALKVTRALVDSDDLHVLASRPREPFSVSSLTREDLLRKIGVTARDAEPPE